MLQRVLSTGAEEYVLNYMSASGKRKGISGRTA
jgi:hypothetical protein